IRCRIHIGRPRTLLYYAQESCRAGRDGLPSEAVIVQPAAGVDPPEWEANGLEPQVVDRVKRYMEPGHHGCRRVVLDHYLDGTVDGYTRHQCGELDAPGAEEQRCDGCIPGWRVHEMEA